MELLVDGRRCRHLFDATVPLVSDLGHMPVSSPSAGPLSLSEGLRGMARSRPLAWLPGLPSEVDWAKGSRGMVLRLCPTIGERPR